MDMVDAVCDQVDDLLGRVDNACLLHSRRIAVSYTHLDVYKRQDEARQEGHAGTSSAAACG